MPFGRQVVGSYMPAVFIMNKIKLMPERFGTSTEVGQIGKSGIKGICS